MTMDVVGRLKQTEELNWDQSVYVTTTYAYNVLDQLTQINQGGQLRSFNYDGHGRLSARITPEQGTTTYTYNRDDTLNTVTDARGASQTFTYNAVGQQATASLTGLQQSYDGDQLRVRKIENGATTKTRKPVALNIVTFTVIFLGVIVNYFWLPPRALLLSPAGHSRFL